MRPPVPLASYFAVFDDGVRVQLLPSSQAAPAAEPGDVNRPAALAPQPQRGQEQPPPQQQGQQEAAGAAAAAAPRRQLTACLLVDCMGHYSSIVKQLRGRRPPDGMLLVVGGCFGGVPPEQNVTADLLATVSDAEHDGSQTFWESFPAHDGRTYYAFQVRGGLAVRAGWLCMQRARACCRIWRRGAPPHAPPLPHSLCVQYTDAHPSRPTFAQLLDSFCAALPAYQGLPLAALQPRRLLFGGFPCYRDAPLRPGWDRVLQIGDAAAGQSPLSFGGFGSMVGGQGCLSAEGGRRVCGLLHLHRPSQRSVAPCSRAAAADASPPVAPRLPAHRCATCPASSTARPRHSRRSG